jgi:excisionase family DNA binding protein
MVKLLTLKETKKLLGVCTKTIQRWDKEGKIRCVRTPGNRRRVPESEILRIIGKIGPLTTPKSEIEPAEKPKTPIVERPTPVPVVKKPKKAVLPSELPRHAILDALAPAGLAQRTAFGDLLSAALVLRTFTSKDLTSRARCPEAITKTFCERMSARGYLTSKNGSFELRVRVVR